FWSERRRQRAVAVGGGGVVDERPVVAAAGLEDRPSVRQGTHLAARGARGQEQVADAGGPADLDADEVARFEWRGAVAVGAEPAEAHVGVGPADGEADAAAR